MSIVMKLGWIHNEKLHVKLTASLLWLFLEVHILDLDVEPNIITCQSLPDFHCQSRGSLIPVNNHIML